jgi:hypothetical protein
MPKDKRPPAKCHLRDVPDELWKEVKHYKLDHPEIGTLSDVVLHLAKIGLKTEGKNVKN